MKRFIALAVSMAALAVFMFPQAASAAPAAIFSASSTGQRDFVDPIVSPGVRSAHEHCFYGAEGVSTTETSADLRTKPATWVETGNHTAVWIPCVYEDGVLLQPLTSKHILLYYKSVPCTEQVPPEDTAGVTHEYGYRNTIGGGAFSPTPPASSTGALVITLFWRADRDLHVNGTTTGVGCFPTIQAYVRLNVGSGPIGNITLGGPVAGVNGATADTTTMHGDYFFGWDRDVFQRFLDNCVIPGKACGTDPTL